MAASFKICDWVVEPESGSLSGPEGECHLEPRVMAVLETLAEARGGVVSKESLLGTVWQSQHVTEDVLHRAVALLRKVLGDNGGEQRLIQTVPKKGYRLLVPVERLASASVGKTTPELTLGAVLASCSDHLYIYDREERYLFASEAGAQAIGLTAAQMIGKSWRDLGMPEEIMEPFHREVASVFARRGPIRQRVSYPTIYGEKTYEYVLDPIMSDEEVLAVLAVVREVQRPR